MGTVQTTRTGWPLERAGSQGGISPIPINLYLVVINS